MWEEGEEAGGKGKRREEGVVLKRLGSTALNPYETFFCWKTKNNHLRNSSMIVMETSVINVGLSLALSRSLIDQECYMCVS